MEYISLIVNEDRSDKTQCLSSTPAYDPPEKIMNQSAANFKSDVWAAGCILYIILTGTHVSWKYAQCMFLMSHTMHELKLGNIFAAFW